MQLQYYDRFQLEIFLPAMEIFARADICADASELRSREQKNALIRDAPRRAVPIEADKAYCF